MKSSAAFIVLAVTACQPASFVVLEASNATDGAVDAAVVDVARDGGPPLDGGAPRCPLPADAPTLRFATVEIPPILARRRVGDDEELAMLDRLGEVVNGQLGRTVLRRFGADGPPTRTQINEALDGFPIGLDVERTESGQDFVVFDGFGDPGRRIVAHRGWSTEPSMTTIPAPREDYTFSRPAVFRESVVYFETFSPEIEMVEVSLIDGSTTSPTLPRPEGLLGRDAFDWGFVKSTETHLEETPYVRDVIREGPTDARVRLQPLDQPQQSVLSPEPCIMVSHGVVATENYVAFISDCIDETLLSVISLRPGGRGFVTQVHPGRAIVPSVVAFTGLVFVTLVWPEGEDAPFVRYFDQFGEARSPPLQLPPPSEIVPLGHDLEVVRIGRRSIVAAAYAALPDDFSNVGDLRLARFEVCFEE